VQVFVAVGTGHNPVIEVYGGTLQPMGQLSILHCPADRLLSSNDNTWPPADARREGRVLVESSEAADYVIYKKRFIGFM
jgi:hypothetical protein